MALAEYKRDMERCSRCSYCKWIPYESWRNLDFIQGCPAVSRYHWHAYSGSGKFNMSYSLLNQRIEYSDDFLSAVYRCHMDGNCDISCKAIQDIEPLQCMQELRIKCVEDGQLLPAHMVVIDGLRKEDNMMLGLKADRGKWAEGLAVKNLTEERAEVLFHAGCRYSYDQELWPVVRGGLTLLQEAGIDIGIMGGDETCCGGRAYEIGHLGELTKFAEHQLETFKTAGVHLIVTPCSDCYHAFKVLYDKIDKKLGIEVLHITQYLDRLIKEGKIKLTKNVPLTVTYHDPCHLGRLSEPWIHWQGQLKKVMGQVIVHDPPKKYRRGVNGVYDPPRDILKSIPGLRLVEMYRIRESAWCCGAGGGTIDAYPDFSEWTANERLREAKATGAEAMVTACPWCVRNFTDAVKNSQENFKVYDIIELVRQAI
jgi:Fe-S oxidoreductase